MSTADHPVPWRWDGESGNMALLDANDMTLVCVPYVDVWTRSPLVRALTSAAPEMEAVLREEKQACAERERWRRSQQDLGDRRDWDGLEDESPEPADCGKCRPCRRAKLLARIDAAKAEA